MNLVVLGCWFLKRVGVPHGDGCFRRPEVYNGWMGSISDPPDPVEWPFVTKK